MARNHNISFDDLNNDLLGRVLERLPLQSRVQLERVSKTWRQMSIQAAWKSFSYCTASHITFLAVTKWLRVHLSERNPENVLTVHLRGKFSGANF